jgi:hypothetical protein
MRVGGRSLDALEATDSGACRVRGEEKEAGDTMLKVALLLSLDGTEVLWRILRRTWQRAVCVLFLYDTCIRFSILASQQATLTGE